MKPAPAATALAFVCLAGLAARAAPQAPVGVEGRVDAIFARMSGTTSPGCAVAVMREGRTILARGYGMANLDHDVVIRPSTIFHVASVSKEFTAAAIVLLAQDGKLTLDDDVRKHIPELPDFGSRITIRHLIHHTSGLRDQWDLLGLAGWRYSLDLITDDDVLQLMTRQKDLNFKPGAEHLYSNTGYTLLAIIVKRVSGQSFRGFTTARLFEPLGMTRTHFRDDHAEIIKGQAYGYVPAGPTFRLSITNFDTAGATSLHTTVEDMARWDQNFYDARVGGRAFVDQLALPGTLNNGEKLSYAFGLLHGMYRGLPTIGHGGADAGYRSDFVRFPTEKLSVVCLCNLATANPGALARQVAEVYLAERLGPVDGPPPLPAAIKLSAETVTRYAGVYWNRETDGFRRFFVRDGALLMGVGDAGSVVTPVAAGRFATVTTEYTFTGGGNGRPRLTEKARAGTAKPLEFEPVEEFNPTESQLAEYSGAYRSEEIDPIFRITVTTGRLTLARPKFPPLGFLPLTRDVFRSPAATIRFVRDARGSVAGFTWNGGRVRGLRFAREARGGS